MELIIATEIDFVPKFNGNKKASPTDQITVRFNNPTVTIKDKCRPKQEAKAIADKQGKIDHMEISLETDDVTLVNLMLIEISGCSYKTTEGGKSILIKKASDLFAAPIQFEPLLKEITAECHKLLNDTDINEKN